jgi:hypothetical protein
LWWATGTWQTQSWYLGYLRCFSWGWFEKKTLGISWNYSKIWRMGCIKPWWVTLMGRVMSASLGHRWHPNSPQGDAVLCDLKS